MRIPHELPDEFPDEAALITRHIKTNYPFRRLTSRYDEVNRQIQGGGKRRANGHYGAMIAAERISGHFSPMAIK